MYQAVNASPIHYACPACFTKKHIQIIQEVPSDPNDRSQCAGCGQYFAVKPERYVDHEVIKNFDPRSGYFDARSWFLPALPVELAPLPEVDDVLARLYLVEGISYNLA